jgi:hypothetical protein
MSGIAPDPGIVLKELLAVDARTWARLLVILRHADHPGSRVVELLALPGSELATGTSRRELSMAIAEDAALQRLLCDAEETPGALRAVLEHPPDSLPRQGGPAEVDPDADVPSDGRRERELRRELTQLRRQRAGAEARATAAEARSEASAVAAEQAASRAEELAERLAAADEQLAQAVARAERRSEARISGLESALATARSELERVTRRADQDRSALETLREQHEALSSELESLRQLVRPEEQDDLDARPLHLPEGIHPDTTEAARWLLGAARLLFVDGYNVSLNLRAGQQLEAQRRWLLERLRPLAAQGRIVPVVVFDGDQSSPSSSTTAGVAVRFTPASLTADDDIVFSVSVSDGSVLVVTDDRELRERVRAEGANVVGGREFLGALDT